MFPFLNKDKPVTIRFLIDSEKARSRMTWDDRDALEAIADGTITSKQLKHLAARFMADDKGEYLPEEKALKVLGGLSGEDIKDTLQKFFTAMQEAIVPNVKSPASNLPSEAGLAKARPDGPEQ